MTFQFSVGPADWGRIAPVLVLIGLALLVMLVELVLPHEGPRTRNTGPKNFLILPILTFIGLLVGIATTVVLMVIGDQQQAFNNMIASDRATLWVYIAILSAAALGTLLSPAYLKRLQLVHQGEYYALIVFAAVGMMFMAAATNFMVIFIGVELLSLALYILSGFIERRRTSQEAGMKYFLLSSFASAFLLYGIALTYAATGSTSFSIIATTVQAQQALPMLLMLGLGLMAVGLAFKVSAVPFQSWTPDVYQGAPAPVTAFMSVGTKAAAMLAFLRIFAFVLGPVQDTWVPILWVLAVLTMVAGNLMAVAQKNTKRLLAYSSIAHGGYLLVGIIIGAANQNLGLTSVVLYLLCYTFLNLGAFGVISLLEKLDGSGVDTADLKGLWHRRPLAAGVLAFFLLALAGFPPMAGFAGKYFMFAGALQSGQVALLIIGVLASVLGMYYYLRVIAAMFMETSPAEQTQVASVPVTPLKSSARSSGRGGVALATKPEIAPVTTAVTAEEEPETTTHNWVSWTALVLSVIGTLGMGTVGAFWIVDLLQHAAEFFLIH